MKKSLFFTVVIMLCLILCACNGDNSSGDQSSTNEQTDCLTEEIITTVESESLIIYVNEKAYLNESRISEITETVELTIDNWSDYITEYTYSYEDYEFNAFGEVVSTETCTGRQLGVHTDRFYRFVNVAIELKDKTTGELISLNFNYEGQKISRFPAEEGLIHTFNLDNYECTRIQGFLHFIDVPEEVIVQTDEYRRFKVYYHGMANEIFIAPGTNALMNW